jgi:hypothetical protein
MFHSLPIANSILILRSQSTPPPTSPTPSTLHEQAYRHTHFVMAEQNAVRQDQERIHRYEAELNDLQKRRDLRQQVARLEAQLSEAIDKATAAIDENDVALDIIHDQEDELTDVRANLEAAEAVIADQTQEMQALKTLNTTQESQINDLKGKFLRYSHENDRLKDILDIRGLEDIQITATIKAKPTTSAQSAPARAGRVDSVFDSTGASPKHDNHLLDQDENDILGLYDSPKLVATVKGQALPDSKPPEASPSKKHGKQVDEGKLSTETCTGAAKLFNKAGDAVTEEDSSPRIKGPRKFHKIFDRDGGEIHIPMPQSVVSDGKVVRLQQGPNDHLDQSDWNRLAGVATWAEDLAEEEKSDYWESFAAAHPRHGPVFWQFLYEKIVRPELLRRQAVRAATGDEEQADIAAFSNEEQASKATASNDEQAATAAATAAARNTEQAATTVGDSIDRKATAESDEEEPSTLKPPSLGSMMKVPPGSRKKKPRKARNGGRLHFEDTTWDRALEQISPKSGALAEAESTGSGAQKKPRISPQAAQSKMKTSLILDKYNFENGVRPQSDREVARRTVRIDNVPSTTLLCDVLKEIVVPGAAILSASYIETSKMRCTPRYKHNTVVLKFSHGTSALHYSMMPGPEFWSNEEGDYVKTKVTLEESITPPVSEEVLFDLYEHEASRVIGMCFDSDEREGYAGDMMELAWSAMSLESRAGLKGGVTPITARVEESSKDRLTFAFEFATYEEAKRLLKSSFRESMRKLANPREVRVSCYYLPDPVGEAYGATDFAELMNRLNEAGLLNEKEATGNVATEMAFIRGKGSIVETKDSRPRIIDAMEYEASESGKEMTSTKAAAIFAHAAKMGLRRGDAGLGRKECLKESSKLR